MPSVVIFPDIQRRIQHFCKCAGKAEFFIFFIHLRIILKLSLRGSFAMFRVFQYILIFIEKNKLDIVLLCFVIGHAVFYVLNYYFGQYTKFDNGFYIFWKLTVSSR